MFDLKNASESVRKAAALSGIWSGQYKPIFDPAEGPAAQIAKVCNRQNPDGIVITAGEADYAQHLTWQDIKANR